MPDDTRQPETKPRSYPQRPLPLPSDATQVILVRHGASAPAVPGERFPLLDGHGDPPLDPLGVDQAQRVGERLAQESATGEAPFAALFSSGLARTDQTAAPLARALRLEPAIVPELREVRLGDWEGGEFRIRVHEGDPVAMQAILQERWDVIPGAETMESLATRVMAGIDAVVAGTGPGATGVAFVHGGIIGEACREATASRPFAFVHSANAAITRLVVFGDGRRLLRSFNDTAHLGGGGIGGGA